MRSDRSMVTTQDRRQSTWSRWPLLRPGRRLVANIAPSRAALPSSVPHLRSIRWRRAAAPGIVQDNECRQRKRRRDQLLSEARRHKTVADAAQAAPAPPGRARMGLGDRGDGEEGEVQDEEDGGGGSVRVMDASKRIAPAEGAPAAMGPTSASAAEGGSQVRAAGAGAHAPPPAGGSLGPSDLKAIADSIPADADALFSCAVDWDAVAASGFFEEKLESWVAAKVKEYLGSEEETLIGFVVAQTRGRCTPQELLKELQLVLDEEAALFVAKLWRLLIFSARRHRATAK